MKFANVGKFSQTLTEKFPARPIPFRAPPAFPCAPTELGWSKSFQGIVLSAFFAGYLLTQTLGGALAGK